MNIIIFSLSVAQADLHKYRFYENLGESGAA